MKHSLIVTLFDDASVREKLTVMTKLDAIWDDARNQQAECDTFAEAVEQDMELGCSYLITIESLTNDTHGCHHGLPDTGPD